MQVLIELFFSASVHQKITLFTTNRQKTNQHNKRSSSPISDTGSSPHWHHRGRYIDINNHNYFINITIIRHLSIFHHTITITTTTPTKTQRHSKFTTRHLKLQTSNDSVHNQSYRPPHFSYLTLNNNNNNNSNNHNNTHHQITKSPVTTQIERN